MCGRYTETRKADEVIDRFACRLGRVELEPRYNIAPGQDAPVVVQARHRMLRMMRWGLIPSWSDSERVGYKMINARAETAAAKPAFRDAFRGRRCLVPADGFYEWKKTSAAARRIPYRFTLKSGGLFAFAGLWELWKDANGEQIFSFAILTTAPNNMVAAIHDRMPVILREDREEHWLNPQTPMAELDALLNPLPDAYLRRCEVSDYVNAPNHEGPRCAEPADAPAPRDGELPL